MWYDKQSIAIYWVSQALCVRCISGQDCLLYCELQYVMVDGIASHYVSYYCGRCIAKYIVSWILWSPAPVCVIGGTSLQAFKKQLCPAYFIFWHFHGCIFTRAAHFITDLSLQYLYRNTIYCMYHNKLLLLHLLILCIFYFCGCVNQIVSRHYFFFFFSLTVWQSECAEQCVTCACQSCDSNHEAASDPARSLSGFSSFTSQTIFGIVVSDTLIVMGRGGCQWSAWISILCCSASRARAPWCNRSLSDEVPACEHIEWLISEWRGESTHTDISPLMDSWSSAHVTWQRV